MNALALQIVLALIRHGLVAVGLERVAHDPEITTKIVAGLFSLGGLIWSFARKIQRQSKQVEVKPIPKVPPAAALLFACLLSVGCVDTRVKLPSGAEFHTKRFLWPGKIGSATINTNGSMTIQGYQSDPDKVIGAISAGVLDGLKKSAVIP